MKNLDITKAFEAWAKPEYAYEWDPIGYQWGNPEAECTGIVVALDLTTDVVRLAREKGANLIITHHPTWFSPVQKLLTTSASDALALETIAANISVYAAHTNLDAAPEGVSVAYAQSLFPQAEYDFLQAHEDGLAGFGVVISFESEWDLDELAEQCRTRWGFTPQNLGDYVSPAHFGQRETKALKKIAFWGGSWDEDLLDLLKQNKVDLLFAGEVKWHAELEMREEGILCVPSGHGQSEAWILPRVHSELESIVVSSLPVYIK